MTNKGFVGFPSTADVVPDGSITAGKLATPSGWGRLVSGYYYFCGSANTSSTLTLGTGSLRVSPWFVPNAVTLSSIGAEVTAGTTGDSGSKFRIGIYADTGACYPGRLVLDAGTIAGDSIAVQEIAINQALAPGLYWVGGVTQVVSVTQPTIRTATGGPAVPTLIVGTSAPSAAAATFGYLNGSVTAALPAVFTSSPATTVAAPRIFVKA